MEGNNMKNKPELALNLGVGMDYQESTPEIQWVNIDCIREFRADLYRDLHQHLPYLDFSVDHIKAKDIIEHFTKYEIPIVFKDWVRVLKKDGTIEVTTPNIEAIKSFSGETLLNLIFGESLFSGVQTGYFGIHKWAFTSESLRNLFTENGLDVIELKPSDGTNLYCLGRKV